MDLKGLFQNKELKEKAKTKAITLALEESDLSVRELLDYAYTARDAERATCTEALEQLTVLAPTRSTLEVLHFAVEGLSSKSGAVLRESGRLIANIAHLYPEELAPAIKALQALTRDKGTVVRWSAATAFAAIAAIPAYRGDETYKAMLEALREREEQPSIQRIYAKALQ